MRTRLYLALLPLALAATAYAAEEKRSSFPSHCDHQEQVIFSCVIGKKVASLCASKDLAKTSGYIQYRFGGKGNIEINVPDKTPFDRGFVKVVRSPSSTANAMALSVKSGDFTYYVYSSESVGGINNSVRSWIYTGGVEVHKGKKVVFSKDCTGKLHDENFRGKLILDEAFDVKTSAEVWAIGSRDPELIKELQELGDK